MFQTKDIYQIVNLRNNQIQWKQIIWLTGHA